ncbi:hypothetical protein I5770_08535 [Brucella sp. BO2]|nr:hypothetical protein I5770_08535 [Brucella sp. BO2]
MSMNAMKLMTDWREGRGYVHTYVCEQIAAAGRTDRAFITEILAKAGLEVVRQAADSLTVLIPETGKNFTLRGAIYNQRQHHDR